MFESLVNAVAPASNQNVQTIGLEAAQNAGKAQNLNGGTSEGGSFEQVLANISQSLQSKIGSAESLSLQQMSGADVGIRDVVNSVMAAERSLNTAIAIRDKIVQAYLEVSRMQI